MELCRPRHQLLIDRERRRELMKNGANLIELDNFTVNIINIERVNSEVNSYVHVQHLVLSYPFFGMLIILLTSFHPKVALNVLCISVWAV
jgi:hypothetical protein